MICLYDGSSHIDAELETFIRYTTLDWNACSEFGQTPLLWYTAAHGKRNTVENTLPMMAMRADLNWLVTVKGVPGNNGISPLTNLLYSVSQFKQGENSLHIVLDRLFDTIPNFPTHLTMI